MDKISLTKVYAMAADCGDGSMAVSFFDSLEACQFAENEDPETYRAEGSYKEVYVTSLDGVHTMDSLFEEYRNYDYDDGWGTPENPSDES